MGLAARAWLGVLLRANLAEVNRAARANLKGGGCHTRPCCLPSVPIVCLVHVMLFTHLTH